MAFKSAAPCSVLREHILLNPGSYATGSGINTSSASDDFMYLAKEDYSPARIQRTNEIQLAGNGVTTFITTDDRHLHDSTAYSTNPTEGYWTARLGGSGSPANTNGSIRGGNTT